MMRQWDYSLMMLWLAAVTVGLVMVASAAYPIALRNGAQTHLVIRHGIYLFGGLAALCICAVVPLRLWLDIHRPLLIAALLLTAMVFLPILGHSAKGSSRWIALGPISIQSAEVAKFALVVYLAGYLSRNQAALSTDAIALVRPLALVGLLCILLLAQPDFGSVVVLAAVTGGVLFLAGARLRHFLLIVVVAGALLAIISVLQPYRLQRMITFLDPWADPFESGYQLTQALIAFGRGDLFGLGLGAGIQKLSYLPEAHNDFIFAVIAEELGLVGALVVFALLVTIVLRIFRIAGQALEEGRTFAAYIAYGTALLLGIQCIINIGVNTGTLPTKGLTLPFISYGGNSLIICCALLGLVLRVQLERGRSR
jgi:cell division protein FtsW